MSKKELQIFYRAGMITVGLMIIIPAIWTVIFWNSPLLIINVALPLLIGACYILPALVFIGWRLTR